MRVINAVLAVLVLFLPSVATSATWHVPSECPTIAAGIDSATYGDTVLVACGTYYEHSLFMKSGLCLRSETGQPDCVTIDAQQLGRVMSCSGVDAATIEGLTLTNGLASGSSASGAGLWCDWYASFTAISCAFAANSAEYAGGGVASVQASPTFVNCTFSENSAAHGGALYLHESPAILTGCTCSSNSAGNGGATYCNGSSPIFSDCTLVGNSGISHGGGLYCSGGAHPELYNTIIAFSEEGASVYCNGTGNSATLVCCDVYGNAGGDWVGCIGSQYGINGNLDRNPMFCGDANPGFPFTIRSDSPCAAENNPECGLIGAWPVGCQPPMATERLTWSSVKALYR